MATYYFETSTETLSEGDVKNIITTAGDNTGNPATYDPKLYTYAKDGSKKVKADGPGDMAVSPLEHAGRQLGKKTISITSVDGVTGQVAPPNAGGPFGPLPRSIGNLLGATNYGITITMSQDTIAKLSAGDYFLYGFKGVQASAGGGLPLVWFRTDDYGLKTDVAWEIQYEAYTSKSAIIPNGEIRGLNSYEADLGQMLLVESPQGTGQVVEGEEGAISISNTTDIEMTCGISEVVGGEAQPLCAFPLYGNGLDVMVPIQKVLLSFSTKAVNTGTVVEQAYTQSILIDLTASQHRDVAFDMNLGWSWGGGSWAQKIAPNSKVAPLLIEKI